MENRKYGGLLVEFLVCWECKNGLKHRWKRIRALRADKNPEERNSAKFGKNGKVGR